MAPWRILFLGTAELACPSLAALCREPAARVIAVVTQPDRPKGRELKPHPSPVKELALKEGLPVMQPERARDEAFIQQVKTLEPDLIVVAAYGQILPPAILDVPRFGCVNVHASLLPKYRGAAPIQWAILDGESETGVTIMKMDPGMDTGDILTQAATPIAPDDNAQTLHDRLAAMGASLLIRTLPDYVSGKLVPRPQEPAAATYARKIKKEDGRLDWRQPARALWNRLRAFTPWPGAYTYLPDAPQPRLLKIWAAGVEAERRGSAGTILEAAGTGIVVGCGEGALRVLELQMEGRRRMSAQEFLAGHALPLGARFES